MDNTYEEYLGLDDGSECDAPKFINGTLTSAGCADRHEVNKDARVTNDVNPQYGMYEARKEDRILALAIDLKHKGYKIRTHGGVSERLEKFVVRCVKDQEAAA